MRNLVVLIALCCLLDNPTAQAQLFGRPRTVGKPLTEQSGPDSQSDAGTLSGSERFLRGNRGRAAFVGADQTEGQSFVGNQQARTSGTIVSSTAGVVPVRDISRQINQRLVRTSAGAMTLPRISLNFEDVTAAQSNRWKEWVTQQVQNAVSLVSSTGIEVSMEGRTVTLRGLVESDREREIAETLASFEPGVSSVRNRLQIRQSPPSQSLPSPVLQ